MNLKSQPFDWNDNFSKDALEDFSVIQEKLPYGIAQSIGMALAKLKLLEEKNAEEQIKSIITKYAEKYTITVDGVEAYQPFFFELNKEIMNVLRIDDNT